MTSDSSAQAALLLAVMFAGTVVYRAQHRQIPRAVAAVTLGLVLTGIATHQWLTSGTGLLRWSATAGAVAATFAVGFTLRHRAVPGVLTWLGTVSYPLYLLHLPVLGLVVRLTDHPLLIVLGFTTATLLAAAAAHRWVEKPGQNLGRRLCAASVATEGGTPSTGSFGKQRESV